MAKQSIYTVGGTVQAGSGLYISRKVDEDLLTFCRDSTFAYILTSRQMGKSSLMVRTRDQLDKEGTTTAIIDLSEIGVEQITAEQWYLGLVDRIGDTLLTDFDTIGWWQERTHFSHAERLARFFQEVVLAQVKQRIVIFVD